MTTFETIKAISADHPCFPDHFPNNPILPGSVLAELVLAAAGDAGWPVAAIDMIKFEKPVRSGGNLRIALARHGETVRFQCTKDDIRVASGRLRLG